MELQETRAQLTAQLFLSTANVIVVRTSPFTRDLNSCDLFGTLS
jgi:hypothetical protein